MPYPNRHCRSPLAAPAGVPFCLLLALCLLGLASPSLAQDFDLRQITENVDIALGAGNDPTGELVASFALGRVDLDVHHIEFMGGMARPWLYGKPKNNPLVRSSLANSGTDVELAPGATMPLGFSFGLDEWEEGNRNLRLIARNGLHLPDMRVNHRLTVTTAFAADGSETHRGAGRLVLGFDLFGGQQEGVAEYDAGPVAQLTHLRMNSEWRLDGETAAIVGLTHRPLAGLSEARFGFRQPVGVFNMTSDVAVDNGGGYAVGVRFSIPLASAPDRESWSLSALVANLRAERRPSAPVESDAASFVDVN